jgi:hypothetical protein
VLATNVPFSGTITATNGVLVGTNIANGISDALGHYGNGSGLTNLNQTNIVGSLWFTNPAAAFSISNGYAVTATNLVLRASDDTIRLTAANQNSRSISSDGSTGLNFRTGHMTFVSGGSCAFDVDGNSSFMGYATSKIGFSPTANSAGSAAATDTWLSRNVAGTFLLHTNLIAKGTLTATNGVFGQYAYANAGTGVVTITSATLLFTNWNYSKKFGGISALETNTTFTITNAGDYRIQFGGRLATDGNGDIMSCNIVTNDVVCSLISLGFTSGPNVKDETGFKSLVLALPANCRVGLNVTNNTPGSAFTVNQILLDIQGAN